MAESRRGQAESRTVAGAAELSLDAEALGALRERLPQVAEETIAAIIVEVPSYAGALSGRMGATIRAAVQTALGNFLDVVGGPQEQGVALGVRSEAAYELGRGEARSGRTMDALLAAYRVGARVAWRGLADTAVATGVAAEMLVKFAELVFAYIDELSAASAAGHADELATSGRARERYLEELSRNLLAGADEDALDAGVERAAWPPPRSLTAVLLPAAQAHGVRRMLDARTLMVAEDVPGLEDEDGMAVLLAPDMDDEAGVDRGRLLRMLRGRRAIVGPHRPWQQVRASFLRAVRALELISDDGDAVDTEEHLVELVLTADPEALDDLRERALAPLRSLRPATALRLADTLRSWLLHRGRREAVAAELFVHAQTVRYRMGQLRELFGDRLDDPRYLLELTLALAVPRPPETET
ncbi:MAG: PucR family transcriptional regulator [Actinophytocola sp.]|nr:PucR family transcriptional regulator [Actinophytocola sp.]